MDKLATVTRLHPVRYQGDASGWRHNPLMRAIARRLLVMIDRHPVGPVFAVSVFGMVFLMLACGWGGSPGELHAMLEELALEKDETP